MMVEVLLEKAVAGESKRGSTFLEDFLHCFFQVKAGKPLKELDAMNIDEPPDEALFRWAIERSRLGSGFPLSRNLPRPF